MDERANDSERRGWMSRVHLSWPMLIAAGWLLYEITAQPGLGALVACAKFGWVDVRAAFWLRRVDPDRWRGRTCFWAYLSYGLWKTAIMATLTMIAMGLFGVLLDQAARRPPVNNGFSPVLEGMLAAAMIGFGLSFPITHLALWSARRNGVRIWLGRAPHVARAERFWPPTHGKINAAPFVGITCIIVTLWFLLLVWGGGMALVVPMGPIGTMIYISASLCFILRLLLGIIRNFSQVFATSPQECWSLEESESVYQIRSADEGTNAA